MVKGPLIVYYAITLLYLAIWIITRKQRDLLFTVVLVWALPFIGLLLSIIQIVGTRGKAASEERFIHLVEGIRQDEPINESPNIAKESNLVPLEEALAISDLVTRRRLLLDVLKGDMDEKVIPLLERAVNNEDTETSHYAVTAVTEIKRKLLLNIQKWAVKYEDHADDMNTVFQYAQGVKRYMTSGFMDKRMQLSYRLTYIKLLNQLINSEYRSLELFSEKLQTEIELEHYDEALYTSGLFLQHFPNSEEAYLSALKLYYILRMKDSFFETLKALKSSKIRVSNSGLNTIRYWSTEGA